ncbi:efflux RND transporter periplasmic adaptor subunit [Aquibium oceanicum]|uniref:Efflux transporter periplasmic adaptor subunit n=1 Tax=Aquibium oceanicum TaxID=1670800 RepID=A0A1L3SU48_9HYPH|nr:efflux RND transporter periplasmic adaptor subunit [Aquibium oceanicum]APH72832.1 efflux transporter periplasmic adaptor subunit [Aquibium oceanicum]
MKTRRVLFSAAAVLLAGAAALGISQDAFTAPEAETSAVAVEGARPPAIRVVPAQRRELVETLEVTGSVVPREEAAVGIDLSGMIVLELHADQGDMVKKGDLLAVLDKAMLETQRAQVVANRAQAEASIAQVRAQITDAEIGVRQADEGLERARRLQEKGIAAQSQLDNAVNAYDSAQAKLVSAQKALAASEAQLGVIDAQMRNIDLQIEKTEVKAPADGLILARNATLGGIVGASVGPLFRIAIDGQLELAADVPETVLPRLSAGLKANVRLPGMDEAIPAEIRMIEPEVDQKLRMGTIRIALSAEENVRAGNFARGSIELLRREGVAVPSTALVYRGSDGFLQRLDGDDKVSTVPVVLGARADGYVEILEGLAEGDEVVSRAGTFVADGDAITPVRGDRTGAVSQ